MTDAVDSQVAQMVAASDVKLCFQPRVTLSCFTVTGLDLMVRLPRLGLAAVPVSTFIPISVSCQLVDALTEWLLEESCRLAVRWPDTGRPVRLLFSLPRPWIYPTAAIRIAAVLARTGLRPEKLEVRLPVPPWRLPHECVERLTDLGVGVCLHHIEPLIAPWPAYRDLPVNALAIRLANDETEESDFHLRQALALAHLRPVRVVADGVTDRSRIGRLCALGFDEAQGRAISTPLASDQIDAYLRMAEWGTGALCACGAQTTDCQSAPAR